MPTRRRAAISLGATPPLGPPTQYSVRETGEHERERERHHGPREKTQRVLERQKEVNAVDGHEVAAVEHQLSLHGDSGTT